MKHSGRPNVATKAMESTLVLTLEYLFEQVQNTLSRSVSTEQDIGIGRAYAFSTPHPQPNSEVGENWGQSSKIQDLECRSAQFNNTCFLHW